MVPFGRCLSRAAHGNPRAADQARVVAGLARPPRVGVPVRPRSWTDTSPMVTKAGRDHEVEPDGWASPAAPSVGSSMIMGNSRQIGSVLP